MEGENKKIHVRYEVLSSTLKEMRCSGNIPLSSTVPCGSYLSPWFQTNADPYLHNSEL